MKKRIKMDSTLLAFFVLMTGVLIMFPNLYPESRGVDNVLDFLGFIVIWKGVLMRMSARGHKKAHSQRSEKLVETGPYALVRNPMYLGSFTMGVGFILMVWPWWSLPIFAGLFYVRFLRQVVKEEVYLSKLAGPSYDDYCRRVPRFFPAVRNLKNIKVRDWIDLDEAFSTKEKRGLWTWPLLAIVLEYLQEGFVFGSTVIGQPILIGGMAAIVLTLGFRFGYQRK